MKSNKILGLLIVIAAASMPLQAAILYVDVGSPSCSDDAGSGTMQIPYCSLQAAYDAAAHSDELRVLPGTYRECLYLFDLATQKGISIVADAFVNSGNNTSTIIDGTGLNCIFSGTGDPAALVNLSNFNVPEPDTPAAGISAPNANCNAKPVEPAGITPP